MAHRPGIRELGYGRIVRSPTNPGAESGSFAALREEFLVDGLVDWRYVTLEILPAIGEDGNQGKNQR